MKIHDPYSLIIFDWDGTLMDSTGRIVSAMQTSARNVGLPVPTVTAVKGIIGLSMQACMDTLFPKAEEGSRQQLLEEYRYQYIEGDSTPTPLFDGVLEQLDWLRGQDIALAVATGKARAGLNRVLTEVGLLEFFDFTIGADEAEGKPHPQMVNRTMERVGSNPSDTLVIGDSVHDINMANNAKVDSIAVTSGANQYHELEVLKPKAVLNYVTDLKQWLQS